MKTASFFTCRAPGRIVVSLGVPKGFEELPVYRALAPSRALLALDLTDADVYEKAYRRQLDALNPNQVLADLSRMAGGHEPVLCCWERPPWTDTNWCHRRMIATWLERHLPIAVPEFEPEPRPVPPVRQLSLFGASK